MPTAADRRAYLGPALFSYGFRPFFLFGAAWAALTVPLWALSAAGIGPDLGRDWHIHEMLFGFVAAVVAGFLTTSIPNWTGRMPVIGAPLALLTSVWGAGRIAMLFRDSLGPITAVIDCAFLVVFAAVVWREVLSGRNWRNLGVCVLVSLLAAANAAFHLNGAAFSDGLGYRAALGAVAVLIALIGGRITPSFTRNWMRAERLSPEPASGPWLDRSALSLTILACAAWTIWPESPAAGGMLMAAGLANFARMARWRSFQVGREPLVWILHAGYAWLGFGLVLLGLTSLASDLPRSAGVHALTAGAIGSMTLAVMTRASRGHTGQRLVADRATLAIYVAILAAGATRVAASLIPLLYLPLLLASSILWFVAFGGFVLAYAPALVRPRVQRD
jgi:uncharacterized protein involved in response to NO